MLFPYRTHTYTTYTPLFLSTALDDTPLRDRAPVSVVYSSLVLVPRAVPPFSDVIDWPVISLHFHAQQAGHILDALDALSDATIERMQAGVRHAWHQHLRPGVANTSFYAQLRRRVSFADAPTAGFSEELREWAMARTETVKTMRKPQEWAAQLRSLSNGSAHAWAPGGALSMGLLGSLNPGNRSCGTYRGKEYCVEL